MSELPLFILNDPAVAQRTSSATRAALEQRVQPISADQQYLADDLRRLLEQIVSAVLPQVLVGTEVDVVSVIDRRLSDGTNAGWRFAVLPPDGEAYTQGLVTFKRMFEQTAAVPFTTMEPRQREDLLCRAAVGDFDAEAEFPLSRWLGMLKDDAVKAWLAHPSTMLKLGFYGFADGASGMTDGPTVAEGWVSITQDTALPFEGGVVVLREAGE
jgi:hypothetical protein